MPARTTLILPFVFALTVLTANPARAEKADAIKSVSEREESTWKLARKIWEFAEPGYQEEQSSKLLADHLEAAGFEVKRKAAGIPTAFTATFGEGEPVIGILGEFDALPGLSQDDVPYRQPREGKTYGHACGHHLFGAASAPPRSPLPSGSRLVI